MCEEFKYYAQLIQIYTICLHISCIHYSLPINIMQCISPCTTCELHETHTRTDTDSQHVSVVNVNTNALTQFVMCLNVWHNVWHMLPEFYQKQEEGEQTESRRQSGGLIRIPLSNPPFELCKSQSWRLTAAFALKNVPKRQRNAPSHKWQLCLQVWFNYICLADFNWLNYFVFNLRTRATLLPVSWQVLAASL